MIARIYKRAFDIMKNKPLKLWGLSLLSGFLTLVILIFGILMPIITIPIISIISAGAAAIYLDGYNGREVRSEQLFEGFKKFPHVAGGMCWQLLWIVLWSLIPIVGPIIVIVKTLSYTFTPYILMRESGVSATEALKKSMIDTKGYKLSMFGALILPVAAFYIVFIILGLLSLIPFVGAVFAVISIIFSIVYSLVAPLFLGLVQAGFYEYARKPVSSAYSYTSGASVSITVSNGETVKCSQCGLENTPDKKFCTKCGAKL